MRYNHQLVKVTNFVLYLALVLPGGTLVGQGHHKGTVRAEASDSSGKGTAAEFLPSGNSVAAGNIVGNHGKGYYRGEWWRWDLGINLESLN